MAHSTPCDVKTIQSDCLSILQSSSCGGIGVGVHNDDGYDEDYDGGDMYVRELCLSLSCPVHRFWPLTDTLQLIVPNELEELWYREMKHFHDDGYYRMVIIFVLVIGWLLYIIIVPWWKKQRQYMTLKSNRGKKLLQKNKHGTRLRFLSKNTTTATTNKRKKD